MRKRLGLRLLSALLVLVLCVQLFPGSALAYRTAAGGLTLTGKDGSEITVDESWEARFPYGTFAFQNSELTIREGGEPGTLRVCRLGGTAGKAVAYIQYVPSFAQISEDRNTYANAAGYGDIRIQVEDPLPIAEYQSIGREPGPRSPAVPTGIIVQAPETGEDYTLTVDAQADAYQWYVLGSGWEEAVSGAVERTFVVGAEDYAANDFYCVYTIDGIRYGSDSAKGAAYVPQAEETPREIPDGLPLNPTLTYSTVEMDPERPYQGYLFAMTFADGEWVKEILISAPQDERAEPDKFGAFTIVDCDGASLYDAANTLSLRVMDDEAPEPSQLGFAVTEVEFDRSAGTAELTVRRTGGKQTVVSADYATQDGTAAEGRDYTPVSGTLMFYADVDEQTITVPLINDGVESWERITFQVILSNVRGGGEDGLCTLAEGLDAAQVSLYNSNTAREEQPAAALYDSEAIDLSSQVTVQSGSVAPVEAAPVTGEQADASAQALEANIGFGPEDIVPYTYRYAEPIRFSRSGLNNYSTDYWLDYMRITQNSFSNQESNTLGLGSWTGGVSSSEGGIKLSSTGKKTAALEIPNISHFFKSYHGEYIYFPERANVGVQMLFGREYVYPWTSLEIGSKTVLSQSCSITHTGGWPMYDFSYRQNGDIAGSWNMSAGSPGYLKLGLSLYDAHDAMGDAYCLLRRGSLERRAFANDLGLAIYTANDQDIAPKGGAQLTAASGAYAAMRPKVSIVSGNGGVNSRGQLYVGSQLKIELPNTAAYFPAQQSSAAASYDYAVYLTDSRQSVAARAKKGSDGAYYLTMDWDALNESGLGEQYTLNVVMTRRQSLTVDITPSVDRLEDANGNILSAIDASKCPQAWQRFGSGSITVGRSASKSSSPHFGDIVEESVQIPSNSTSTSFKKADLENVQWINFNRAAEDRIVFNGQTYAGNEQIWLTGADLSSSNLVFYYYHRDFLTSESLMVPTVDHIGLYLDGDGNGRIDGYFDRASGYFVLDETFGDEFLLFLEDGADYDESVFAPVYRNGKYCQYFLKVFYTKLPRCLVPQSGQEDQRAQILPAFISNITDPGSYAALTEEQQSYRYIIAGQNRAYPDSAAARSGSDYACSADGLPMYGGAATRMEVLDIPLGGDVSPVQLTADRKGYTWTPDFQGNLLCAFPSPEPIFIPHSLAGDNIPLTRTAALDENGNFTYEPGGADKLNGYLGSFAGSSGFALCVQEQTQTTAQIAAANGGTAWSGVLETGGASGGGGAPELEAVTIGGVGTFPNAEYLKRSKGKVPEEAGIDMINSGNQFEEFNLDMGIRLPSTEIEVTDFVTIIMDEYEVGFSIGLPLGGYSDDDGWSSPADALRESKEDMGKIKDFLMHPGKDTAQAADDSYEAAGKGEFSSTGFEVSFDMSMAFLFKYNPVDNTYYFSQFSLAAAAGLEFNYQHRWSVCPIVYLYITVGAGVEISTGATLERQTETKAVELFERDRELKTGEKYSFATQYKAFDIQFDGKLLVELFDDIKCEKPVTEIGGSAFNLGFIKSNGDDPVTVTMLQKDGFQLNEEETYFVRLTALEDTSISNLEKVTRMETISYWNGFEVSPEAFVEAGAGIGIEILKAEVFIKPNLSCSMTLGSYDADENAYDGFAFNEFEFALAFGFRVVLLVFSYEMDLVSYSVSYEDSGWSHSWAALGGLYGDEISTLSVTDASGQTYGVRVRLPGSTAHTQEIYTGEDSGISTFAFNPTDEDKVPFQLSGYGSSGDAFRLADGLALGYDYQVVTVGGQNYVIYTISREGGDLHPVDYTMLVLSRLRLTNEGGKDSYGLVNPINAEDNTPYILLDTKSGNNDDDGTGDLGFHAWVDGTTIHAAWVSYGSHDSLGAFGEEPEGMEKPTLSDGTPMDESNYTNEGFDPMPPAPVPPPTEPAPVEPQREDYYLTEEEYKLLGDDARRNYTRVPALDSDSDDGDEPAAPDVFSYINANYSTLEDAQRAFESDKAEYAAWAEANAEYEAYLAEKSAYEAANAAYEAWRSYFKSLADYNSLVQNIAAKAAKNTVVKTASFNTANTANPGSGFTAAQSVSGPVDSHVFLPNVVGEDVVVYGKAVHFETSALTKKVDDYQRYLNKAYSGGEAMNAIREYRLAYQKGLWDAYGKSSMLCVYAGGIRAEAALLDGQILENIEAAQIDGTYYVAYTTGQQSINGDLLNIRRLYLRTFTVSDSIVTWNAPLLLRTLYDYDSGSGKDGVYTGQNLTEAYDDPYFANLQFLRGKLGGLQGTEEDFQVQALSADAAEQFLLFEMNGSTYVIPQSSLKSIVTSYSGRIVPFFAPPETDNTKRASTGRTEVTIGADGAGNIAAVYTGTVANTTNNAIYMTKWDPNSQTWGVGVMLAMNYMQVYEDAAEQGWNAEETEAAYLGLRTGYSGGGMDQFTFSNLQIALGQTAAPDGGGEISGSAGSGSEPDESAGPMRLEIPDSTVSSKDTLLILTQGSMRYLKQSGDKTVPMSDSQALAKWQEGSPRKPGVGVYAISYGVGGQGIGQSRLTFQRYDFSAGSELTAYLSFVNTGDAAIRASEANPATVKLKLYVPGGVPAVLADWDLTETVRSGQAVRLEGSCVPLTQDLPVGSIFYTEVGEDEAYIASAGGTAFLANTLIANENGTPIDGDLVVESRPELALEDVRITSVNADANGNTILQVEFLAANRGSETAKQVFARFRYEDGSGTYLPLDISSSDLNISKASAITAFALRDTDPKTQGILYLNSGEGSDDGSLSPGMYRKVSGTITVPSDVYRGNITGSLNLHVELFSAADPAVNTLDTQTYVAEHGEYNSANNVITKQIEHKTFFTAADQVILALGTTVRLPVAYTTTGKRPNIQAEEVPDTDNDGAQLGILYYESTGAGSGVLVITPSAQGTGVIHLKDETTNTIRSIPFKVVGAGEGIDIYRDNGIFTFYNKDKSEYDNTAQVGAQNWRFVENVVTWGSGSAAETPMRSNLSEGEVGSYFTFTTMAASIDLYFSGTVQVSSTFPGFAAKTCTGAGGSQPVRIDFGSNPNNMAHTVTVKVTGSDAAKFDRMAETYTHSTPTPSDDGTAPHIYWSRSFPETASIKTGAKGVELTCYVLDDGTLASLTLNGTAPGNLIKNSSGFWQFTTTVRENGSLQVIAADASGNRTSRTVRVDWFNDVPGGISSAPKLEGEFQTEEGNLLENYLAKGSQAYLAAVTPETLNEGETLTASRIMALETADGVSELEETALSQTEDGRFIATANGWYILKLEDRDNGTWRQVVLEMDKVDADAPVVNLSESPDREEWALLWSAYKSNPRLTPIQAVQINGEPIDVSVRQTHLAGTWPIQYSGQYTLIARDEAGNKNAISYTVENSRPLALSNAENLVSVADTWNQDADNGSVTVDLTGVTGGKYVVQSSKEYVGSYDFRIVPAPDAPQPEDGGWTAWDNEPIQIDHLRAGDYLLCIRDRQDPENENVAVTYPFTVGSDAISFTTQTTEASGPSASDGSVTVEAAGGKDKKGTYQFLITPLEEENSPLTPIDELTEEWRTSPPDSESLSALVLDGLAPGWYQIAVRTMADVSQEDLEDLRALYDAMTEAQLRADAAARALDDQTEAESRLHSQINRAVSQWNEALNAVQSAGDEEKAAAQALAEEAEAAYKKLIQDDPDILEALKAWRDVQNTEKEPALEAVYDEAVNAYVKKQVGNAAEAEKNRADAALEAATAAYTEEKAKLYAAVNTAYGEDPELWTNALTVKVYVGYRPPSSSGSSGSSGSGSGSDTHTVTAKPCDGGADCPSRGFTDLRDVAGAWYHEAVDYALQNGLMNGYGNGLFGPDRVLSRAQLVQILYNLEGKPAVTNRTAFTDVAPDAWCADAIAWAAKNGVVNGYSDGRFGPNDSITREQFAAILWRYAKSPSSAKRELRFSDADKISGYALNAIRWAVENGVLNGYGDGRLNPKGLTTRAQTAQILKNFLEG